MLPKGGLRGHEAELCLDPPPVQQLHLVLVQRVDERVTHVEHVVGKDSLRAIALALDGQQDPVRFPGDLAERDRRLLTRGIRDEPDGHLELRERHDSALDRVDRELVVLE